MRVVISNASPDPIYEQITRQIKNQIITGELKEGDALPSIRKLAQELRISVITTKRAYEELEKEGFLDSVEGKGTFVAAQNKEFIREKQVKMIEEKLVKAIDEAKMLGIKREELNEMIEVLYDYKELDNET